MITARSRRPRCRAARARSGQPAGIGLLTKWITCALSGGLADVGRRCVRLAPARPVPRCHPSRALRDSPQPIITRRASSLIVDGRSFRKNIAAAVPGLNALRPIAPQGCIAIDTSPKSMSTGHGASHLWQTVQWSATSENSSKWRSDAAPRLLLRGTPRSKARSRGSCCAAVEQVRARHVRRAHRFALAAAQAVLTTRRSRLMSEACGSGLIGRSAKTRRVRVREVAAGRQQLARVEPASRSTRRL